VEVVRIIRLFANSLNPFIIIVWVGVILSIIFEKLINFLVVVYDTILLLHLSFVQLLEEPVHVLGTELKVVLHLLNPLLIHFIEVVFNQILDLIVVNLTVIIKINLNYVSDEQQ
jgi:hypothetical protein